MVFISLERSIEVIRDLANILSSPSLRKQEGFTVSRSEKKELQDVALDLIAVLENIPDNPEVSDA